MRVEMHGEREEDLEIEGGRKEVMGGVERQTKRVGRE